jgi:hypothetical protein
MVGIDTRLMLKGDGLYLSSISCMKQGGEL